MIQGRGTAGNEDDCSTSLPAAAAFGCGCEEACIEMAQPMDDEIRRDTTRRDDTDASMS